MPSHQLGELRLDCQNVRQETSSVEPVRQPRLQHRMRTSTERDQARLPRRHLEPEIPDACNVKGTSMSQWQRSVKKASVHQFRCLCVLQERVHARPCQCRLPRQAARTPKIKIRPARRVGAPPGTVAIGTVSIRTVDWVSWSTS